MLIDTHCHLDFKDFDNDRDVVLRRSRENGVSIIINVGSSMSGTKRSIELAEKNDFVYAAIGIHPHEADNVREEDLEIFEGLLKMPKVIAVGEIGLDYYKNISSNQNQKRLFARLLEKAKSSNLPLIIHNRDAHKDIIAILRDVMGDQVKGVMHCFSGDQGFLETCLAMGFFISFTCNITFKNAGRLRQIAGLVPMDRLLVETDAPFLAPQDFRGKRNEPMYVRYVAEEIAKIKGLSFEEVANITTENAQKLFRIRV